MADWRQTIASVLAEAKAKQETESQHARAKRDREVAVAKEFVRPGAELFVDELKRQSFDARIEDAGAGVDVLVNGPRGAWMEARVSEYGHDADELGYRVDFYFHGEVGYEQYRGNNVLHLAPLNPQPISPEEVAEKFTGLFLERLKPRTDQRR